MPIIPPTQETKEGKLQVQINPHNFVNHLKKVPLAPGSASAPPPPSSPAAVDPAGLGLEGAGQRGLVILEANVVAQEVGAGEKLDLKAEREMTVQEIKGAGQGDWRKG